MEQEQTQPKVITIQTAHSTKLVRQFEEILHHKHLSYRTLADQAGEGVHAPHINRMVTGGAKPTIDFLEKCLNPMGYTLAIVPKK